MDKQGGLLKTVVTVGPSGWGQAEIAIWRAPIILQTGALIKDRGAHPRSNPRSWVTTQEAVECSGMDESQDSQYYYYWAWV